MTWIPQCPGLHFILSCTKEVCTLSFIMSPWATLGDVPSFSLLWWVPAQASCCLRDCRNQMQSLSFLRWALVCTSSFYTYPPSVPPHPGVQGISNSLMFRHWKPWSFFWSSKIWQCMPVPYQLSVQGFLRPSLSWTPFPGVHSKEGRNLLQKWLCPLGNVTWQYLRFLWTMNAVIASLDPLIHLRHTWSSSVFTSLAPKI